MTQISKYPLKKAVYQQISHVFDDAIVRLSTPEKVQQFISDFFTPTEKIMFIKRMAIFVMLAKGYSYKKISAILKVSPPTIAAASRYYKYLGKGSRELVQAIIQDERMKDFWLMIGEKITDELATVRKGSAVWRTVHQVLSAKRRSNKL